MAYMIQLSNKGRGGESGNRVHGVGGLGMAAEGAQVPPIPIQDPPPVYHELNSLIGITIFIEKLERNQGRNILKFSGLCFACPGPPVKLCAVALQPCSHMYSCACTCMAGS